ncbi:MAG: hypothetical protein WBX11_09075 [Thiobacillaceae bacterium]
MNGNVVDSYAEGKLKRPRINSGTKVSAVPFARSSAAGGSRPTRTFTLAFRTMGCPKKQGMVATRWCRVRSEVALPPRETELLSHELPSMMMSRLP